MILIKKLKMIYYLILSHQVECNVVVNESGLVYVTLIPLDNFALTQDVLAYSMLMQY